jgi:hypothetical protein
MPEAASCNDMKVGEIWACADCGLELQVVKACSDEGEGACCSERCEFTCCGEPLRRKEG